MKNDIDIVEKIECILIIILFVTCMVSFFKGTMKFYSKSNNRFDIKQEASGEVSDSLFNNMQNYYVNQGRERDNKFVNPGKDVSPDYYDFKYIDRDDGYREFNNIRAIYKYMPNSINMKIAINANVGEFILIDKYENINFRISDEGDSMLCYIYNKYPDKTLEMKQLIYEDKNSNKTIEVKGVFQMQPENLNQFNIFVYDVEIIN